MRKLRVHCGRLFRCCLLIAGIFLGASPGLACTIPVFRYALERWEADRLLVIVYHDGPLPAGDDAAVQALAQRSSLAGGPLNIEVVRYDVGAPPAQLPDLQPPANQALPWVEIRSRSGGPKTVLRWQGPLAEARSDERLFDSPARAEVVRRILDGDAAVWLVVTPEGEAAAVADALTAHLDNVRRELVLPGGIGSPGSELYASIPLEIRFSVLTVSHTDASEQHFFKQLAASAKEWNSDNSYVIPVFGRLRALEVIPHAEVDELLVRDVCEFLCAACSCQVKAANPGFDLLATVNWNERLFGDAPRPPTDATAPPILDLGTSDAADPPSYVAIPKGNDASETSSARAHADISPSTNPPSPPAGRPSSRGVITLAAVAVLIGVVTVTFLSRRLVTSH